MKKNGMSQAQINLALQGKLEAKRFVNETFDVFLLFVRVCVENTNLKQLFFAIPTIFHRGSVGASAQLSEMLKKWKTPEWLILKITDAMELK